MYGSFRSRVQARHSISRSGRCFLLSAWSVALLFLTVKMTRHVAVRVRRTIDRDCDTRHRNKVSSAHVPLRPIRLRNALFKKSGGSETKSVTGECAFLSVARQRGKQRPAHALRSNNVPPDSCSDFTGSVTFCPWTAYALFTPCREAMTAGEIARQDRWLS